MKFKCINCLQLKSTMFGGYCETCKDILIPKVTLSFEEKKKKFIESINRKGNSESDIRQTIF